jgi:acyl-coenzyme A synthetase/AMP-(fatty) acid ligase
MALAGTSRTPASSCSAAAAEATLVAGRDHDWAALVGAARRRRNRAACVPVAATDPLYILYTSGTTGKPKGVVRDNGGHMVALKWSMKNIYGVEPGEVFWAASDVGWVVGHSYIVYAPLLHGCDHHPLRGQAGRHARRRRLLAGDRRAQGRPVHRADRLPRHQEGGSERRVDRQVRSLETSARCSSPASAPIPTPSVGRAQAGVPVIDHWWQTETGWAIAGNPVGLGLLPVKHGSPTVPMPGYDVRCSTRLQARCRRHDGPSWSSCRCRRAACRRCGTPTSASESYLAAFPATTRPRTPASSTRTAISTSWAAPTTSSTSPATACRPAAWRRCWPRIRTSPNAP